MTVRDIRGMSDDFVVFEVGISSKAKKSSKRKTPLLLPFLIYSILLCLVELFLPLLASRTFPVIRQIFKCKAVMLGRIIHIAADRTDILACPFLCYKIVLRGPDGRRRIIETSPALLPGFHIPEAYGCCSKRSDGCGQTRAHGRGL